MSFMALEWWWMALGGAFAGITVSYTSMDIRKRTSGLCHEGQH
jgi:hypothetical protein